MMQSVNWSALLLRFRKKKKKIYRKWLELEGDMAHGQPAKEVPGSWASKGNVASSKVNNNFRDFVRNTLFLCFCPSIWIWDCVRLVLCYG
jgi:hypothetical protein